MQKFKVRYCFGKDDYHEDEIQAQNADDAQQQVARQIGVNTADANLAVFKEKKEEEPAVVVIREKTSYFVTDTARNGIITAIGIFLGFLLNFLVLWTFPWSVLGSADNKPQGWKGID